MIEKRRENVEEGEKRSLVANQVLVVAFWLGITKLERSRRPKNGNMTSDSSLALLPKVRNNSDFTILN
jgi:hypothetical protein